MRELRELRVRTDCGSCVNKCCSQPYDWVYLTSAEISRLKTITGLVEDEFVVTRLNENTGHVFRTLDLPCRFLDSSTGRCNVYEVRPLVCRLFPFYPEPLTGHTTLMPAQCGENLHFVPDDVDGSWCLMNYEKDARQWLAELWNEALLKTSLSD